MGKDQGAQAFLAKLDNDPVIGRMVDATSYYELEAMEYQQKGIVLTPGGRCQFQRPCLEPLLGQDPYPMSLRVLYADLWMVKLMVGAVDPSYDEQD